MVRSAAADPAEDLRLAVDRGDGTDTDLGIYAEWCSRQGLRALPAGVETVAGFVDAMAETRKPATERRYVASIAVAHKAIGCGKTLESPVVRLALKRMHRRKDRRQDKARALT